ncbi:MAG: DUF692 domain-containing protein [Polyangia bacterium]
MSHLGHGIGLRREHYSAFVSDDAPAPAEVDWLEVITENFLVPGGNPRRVLRKVRERWPVVMHGVSLSIGSTDPLDLDYLDSVRALATEIEPAWVSDHVCWGVVDGRNAHDLLPLPYNEDSLTHVVARVAAVQERLGRQLVLENVSSYVEFASSDLTEAQFLSELATRADCRLLVDVNNIFVSAHNHGWNAHDYLRALPRDRVAQYHLAGPSAHEGLWLDTHDHPVLDEVWSLYETALELLGPHPTLVEWDASIPPLGRVIEESTHARRVEAAFLARAHVSAR